MRILFFGSSDFAMPALEVLLGSRHEVELVVTQPDRKSGRHLKEHETPVKTLASSRGIRVYQPETVGDGASLDYLRTFQSDLFVVVAFGQILSKEVLEIPRFYAVNLHASLLPKYRGAAPVNWAVINGEKVTGLSVIRMNERMDAGDILLQKRVGIEEKETAGTLSERLAHLGSALLLDAVCLAEEKRLTFKKQDDRRATRAPKLKKEDGAIDWNASATEIHNRVRGTFPWPGAYTYFEGDRVTLGETTVADGTSSPGEIFETKPEFLVGTKKGLIRINVMQIEGKRRMSATDFLRGHANFQKGKRFDASTGQTSQST